jgi:hypothetical protein
MAALPLDRLDLRPSHLAMVRALLSEYLPAWRARAFSLVVTSGVALTGL